MTISRHLKIIILAGMEGFEPPNAGTRNQCLTTWRHPISAMNALGNCTLTEVNAQVAKG